MDDERLIRTEVEFAVADSVWRHELTNVYGPSLDEDDLSSDERRGEVGSALRTAFEDRRRSLQAFRIARGVA